MTTAVYAPPDQRPQLMRMSKERRRFCLIWAIASIFLALIVAETLFVTIRLFIYPDVPYVPNIIEKSFNESYVLDLGVALFILATGFYFISIEKNLDKKQIRFHCPSTRCPGASLAEGIDATVWKCRKCGNVHRKAEGSKIWCRVRIIGDRCLSCKESPSHFFCPDCSIAILLDETRPRTTAARVPGWQRPARPPASPPPASPQPLPTSPGSPLSGFSAPRFDDEDLD